MRVFTESCVDQWLLDLQIRITSCEKGSYLKRAKYRLTPEGFRKSKFWPSDKNGKCPKGTFNDFVASYMFSFIFEENLIDIISVLMLQNS